MSVDRRRPAAYNRSPYVREDQIYFGLDPARIKMVILTHGHADHFGGTPYLQEHYRPHVDFSAADWNLMENPAPGLAQKGPPPVLSKHDMVIAEGQPIVLGDERVMPVAIPGYTLGSMGLIFAVKDGGKTHMAALYGGTILLPGIVSDGELQQYLHSIARFKDETKKAVDVPGVRSEQRTREGTTDQHNCACNWC